MRKISFIPLRRGSKGVAGKNTRLLGSKPLFCWVLDTIIASREFDEIWVSTDCPVVCHIVENQYSTVSLHNRSGQNATDTSPSIDVVMEFLAQRSHCADDWFVLFQATSPFTAISEIQHLCRVLETTSKDSALACFSSKRFRWCMEGVPLDYQWKNKPRRQDYEGMLLEAGAFYASRISSIIHSQRLMSAPAEIIEVSELTAFDINTYMDFEIAEVYIKQQRNDGLLPGIY